MDCVGSWQPGYAFPSMREASTERARRVTSVRSSLKSIAAARNAYFHISAGSPVAATATKGAQTAEERVLEEMGLSLSLSLSLSQAQFVCLSLGVSVWDPGKVLHKLRDIKSADMPLSKDDGSLAAGGQSLFLCLLSLAPPLSQRLRLCVCQDGHGTSKPPGTTTSPRWTWLWSCRSQVAT